MSNKHLTTQELDEALADFRQETLKTMAKGEALEAVVLGANTDTRILQIAHCKNPGDLLDTVARIFASQATRVFSLIDDEHADKREEVLTDLLKNLEEQIRSQLK